MSTTGNQLFPLPEKALQLIMELSEVAVTTRSFKEFAERVLPNIARVMNSRLTLLYIADSRLLAPLSFHHGFEAQVESEMEKLCTEQFDRISSQTDLRPASVSTSADSEAAISLMLYPLRGKETCIGLIGLMPYEDKTLGLPVLWERVLNLIANTVSHLADRIRSERQLVHLNAYQTVSSMLAQSLGLHELLEVALYSSIELVSAEAASVLLLDDEKKDFSFYQVEGPTKSILMKATFPADKGIAGSVLQTLQPEVVNDVQHDPRFYGKIDSESRFQTRNMITIPLVAGEERVGVLELLNKVDGDSFAEEDRIILISIAELIAFAIRNAKVFEYVANTYCKQRQGQSSCKGCKRPLGSWTPCVKYRESEV